MQQLNRLFDSLATKKNIVCITPNQRLCHHLNLSFALQQKANNINCYESLPIIPINQWIQQIWERYCQQNQVLLTKQQEIALWRKCLEQNSIKSQNELIHHSQLAASAWKRLHSWRINIDNIPTTDHLGFKYFKNAAQLFKTKCSEKNWTTSGEKINQLTWHLQKENKNLEKKDILNEVILLNFDEINPAQKLFFTTYNELAKVIEVNITNKNSAATLNTAKDTSAEIANMAKWSHQQWLSNPHQEIACVVPHLNQTRDKVEQAFLDYFQPKPEYPGEKSPPLPFNISVGKPISNHPIINSIINTADIDNNLSLSAIYNLWQNPYLQQNPEEKIAAATIEQIICQIPSAGITTKKLTEILNKLSISKNSETTKSLAKRWGEYLTQSQEKQKYYSRSKWLQLLYENAKNLGWPGYRTLDSAEYQTLQAFYLLAQEYASADYIENQISKENFIRDIKTIAEQYIFQPQTKTPAKIHILGALEAAGTLYDAIWISDLNAEQWPAKAQPHPFLPAELQRQHNMPHSSADRELEMSEKLLSRLINSAPKCIMSYATHNQDAPQSPSPLIEKLHIKIKQALDKNPAKTITTTQPLDSMVDNNIKPFAQPELLSGGSGLCRSQSQCPFKGFAKWHLRLKPLKKGSYGIDHIHKGILLHRSLQKLWEDLKDQQSLIKLSPQQLTLKIKYHVDKAIKENPIAIDHNSLMPLLEIEAKRLQKIIIKWTELEKNRTSFSVAACEKKQTINIASHKLNLQIDRIDQLEDKTYRLIDYKSGQIRWQDWFGERIAEPQLPLYTVQNQYPISSLSYASLKAGNLKYEGLAANNSMDQQIKTIQQRKKNNKQILPDSWEDCIKQWQQKLQNTINEFINGSALANPINQQICKQCDFQTLCRINYDS